ncbi:MAG: ATP phosphoribosyltransferase regulatory subunit [Thermoanaerobaculia bacterium]|nr:ATP phosphoribosyltransferase regulatory subunit [Thermoanaerobaculia bacterium]
MRVSAELPLGVVSLFGEAARRRRGLERVLVELLEERGYEEVILPVLDYVEPYERLLTPEARGELYRFSDRDGEPVALRADFTPMLARLVAPRVESLDRPCRFFYRGDVVRYQEARVGRRREMYQLGVELLGAAGEEGEETVLRLLLELLEAVADGEARVVLGLAGALDPLLGEVPDPDRLVEAVARRERSPAREGGEALLEVVKRGRPEDPEVLGPAMGDSLRRLRERSRMLEEEFPRFRIEIDLAEFARIRRPGVLGDAGGERAYYDGVVFKAYAGDEALPVATGGRYDTLFARLGAPIPAVGFSLGLDRLVGANGGSG